jgi:hypothetical protein
MACIRSWMEKDDPTGMRATSAAAISAINAAYA